VVGIRAGRVAFNLPRGQVSREAVHQLYSGEAA
jgi:ABC-type phosphate/phosphonate transport system ATPase subunit